MEYKKLVEELLDVDLCERILVVGLINLELMDPPPAKRGSNNPWPQVGEVQLVWLTIRYTLCHV